MPRRAAALVALTFALVLLPPAPLGGQDLLLDRFRGYLESLRTQTGIPGLSAALIGTSDVVWEYAFGRQDVERSIPTTTITLFQLDGLTQVFTASILLRCVEEGTLSLEDRIGRYQPDSPDADATIQQILTHTSGTSGNLVFAYRPERLAPLRLVARACAGDSHRETLANLLERLAMIDSVPGLDAIHLVPPAEGIPSPAAVERYTRTLERLAVPYAVDKQRRATPSQYVNTTLTPSSGLISTVRDFAQFDLALKRGLLLRADTLAAAWSPPLGADGRPLPHGIGLFVQSYKGEPVGWQFGVSDNASSSLVITLPSRGLTLVLLANSHGLVRPFALADGDVMASPFGRLFLELFVR
jgi:CubicO group peptidase (beta-lactamase class C family)